MAETLGINVTQSHQPLPAGTHILLLDNLEMGIHQTVSVTIKAGESMKQRLGLK